MLSRSDFPRIGSFLAHNFQALEKAAAVQIIFLPDLPAFILKSENVTVVWRENCLFAYRFWEFQR